MRINNDLVNHHNTPNDAQTKLKTHAPHIKFVDMNDANKVSVVIFVDMDAEKKRKGC